MLNRSTTSHNNRQLFVKSNGPSGTNLGDLDTELNKKNVNNVTTIDNYIERLNIPPDNVMIPDLQKRKKCSKEWRWRIINVDNKTYAEISYFEQKTKKRFYMSGKTSSWEEQMIDPMYDTYVDKEYYYYTY